MLKKIILITIPLLLLAAGIATYQFNSLGKRVTDIPKMTFPPTSPTIPTKPIGDTPRLSVVAENLSVPWALAFLPNGDLLLTERAGLVKKIDTTGTITTIATIADVLQTGESGLHGITPHPDFATNNYLYFYYTYADRGTSTQNRVVRYILRNNTLTDRRIIVDEIPGAIFHDGGRIKFGPDKLLYISTGDAQEPSLAQNKQSLAGKILRLRDDGTPAADNPFNTRIYSYGHRNPQGITWDDAGMLWATEHGPSTHDEINRIEKGNNYGWPDIQGQETQPGMQLPFVESGTQTWAPGGIAFTNDSLYFTGLRGQALFQLNRETKAVQQYLNGELGRIRDVVVGPDGMLYISTSNRDGRGAPEPNDDRILRVNPSKL